MSFLASVTPLILTYNEAANIGRVLERLDWAQDIVVVDSGSTDETRDICSANPRVRLFTRDFDAHARQWNYGLEETAIKTDWVLALDADYILTPEAKGEIEAITPDTANAGYWFSFRYAVFGKVLRSGVYPPVLALYRRGRGRYLQDGHTQRLALDGPAGWIAAPMVHDDRKSLDRWLSSQMKYARLEAEKLEAGGTGLKTWLRTKTPFGPFAMGFHILVLRGGLFEGPAAWLYAMQRMLAEALIGCARLDRMLRDPGRSTDKP